MPEKGSSHSPDSDEIVFDPEWKPHELETSEIVALEFPGKRNTIRMAGRAGAERDAQRRDAGIGEIES